METMLLHIVRLCNYWKHSIHCIAYCETFSYMGKTFDTSVSNQKERSFGCSVLGKLCLCLCGAQGTSLWQAHRCSSAYVCVPTAGRERQRRGRGGGRAVRLSREGAAGWARQTLQSGGWRRRSVLHRGRGLVLPRLTTEGSGGRQVSRFFFSKNSAHEWTMSQQLETL